MSSEDTYVCTLDRASLKKAKDELNENPDDRLAAVQALREWVKEQPHIKCPVTDTAFLLRLLRWSKFSQIRAREKLECYLNLKNEIPSVYADLDTREKELVALIDAGYIINSPIRHPNGFHVIMFRVCMLHKLKYKWATYQRLMTVLIEYISRQDMTQVNGIMLIGDYTDTSPAVITKFLNKNNSRIIKAWMAGTPARFKGVHYYNAGLLVEMIFGFLRPVLPKKIMDRISVHDTMESIYKVVPKQCLPVEYLPDDYTGPNAGTMQECIDKMKASLHDKEFHDHLLYRSSQAFTVDMSKKPNENVTQHFRKLNID